MFPMSSGIRCSTGRRACGDAGTAARRAANGVIGSLSRGNEWPHPGDTRPLSRGDRIDESEIASVTTCGRRSGRRRSSDDGVVESGRDEGERGVGERGVAASDLTESGRDPGYRSYCDLPDGPPDDPPDGPPDGPRNPTEHRVSTPLSAATRLLARRDGARLARDDMV